MGLVKFDNIPSVLLLLENVSVDFIWLWVDASCQFCKCGNLSSVL